MCGEHLSLEGKAQHHLNRIRIAYMKAIVIQPTKGNTGFTASVVGMKNYQAIAADEITALKQLVEKLEKKNPKFIIRPEYVEY